MKSEKLKKIIIPCDTLKRFKELLLKYPEKGKHLFPYFMTIVGERAIEVVDGRAVGVAGLRFFKKYKNTHYKNYIFLETRKIKVKCLCTN